MRNLQSSIQRNKRNIKLRILLLKIPCRLAFQMKSYSSPRVKLVSDLSVIQCREVRKKKGKGANNDNQSAMD